MISARSFELEITRDIKILVYNKKKRRGNQSMVSLREEKCQNVVPKKAYL